MCNSNTWVSDDHGGGESYDYNGEATSKNIHNYRGILVAFFSILIITPSKGGIGQMCLMFPCEVPSIHITNMAW